MAKILIIDDEELVRSTIRKMLENVGHEIREAGSGIDGIRMFKEQPADVVITDIIMPDQEGIDTIIQLRSVDPDVKIIAVSGGGRVDAKDYLAYARKFGASFALEKPFERKDIVDAVNACAG